MPPSVCARLFSPPFFLRPVLSGSDTIPQRLHQINDVALIHFGLNNLNLFAGCLAPDKLFQGILIAVLEFAGVEVAMKTSD